MPDYAILANTPTGILRSLAQADQVRLEDFTPSGLTEVTLTAAEMQALLRTLPPAWLAEALTAQGITPYVASMEFAPQWDPAKGFHICQGCGEPGRAHIYIETGKLLCQTPCPQTREEDRDIYWRGLSRAAVDCQEASQARSRREELSTDEASQRGVEG